MKHEKACGAVIYDKKDGEIRYLVIKQKRHGDWAFPKGHVEGKESEEETALREIHEETGLKVKLTGNFRYSIGYIVKGNVKKEVVYFTAVPIDMEVSIQKSEVEEYRWLNYEETLAILSHENLKKVFLEASEDIKLKEK